MQVVNLSGPGLGGDAGTGPGAGRRAQRQPQQRQPGHRTRRPAADDQHVPVAAGGRRGVPAVRRRRLRHDGDRSRVHARDHQPHDRRPGQRYHVGFQGGSMGEAWGDLTAAEYLFENNFRAPGDTPFVTGAYVTGNTTTGIRDYDASKSPLNYSDVGFDLVGPEVHADGEIWVATNLRVRAGASSSGTARAPRRCSSGAPTARSDRLLPGQPALDPAHVRLVPAAGVQLGQHGRHARQHARRRPGPLRRGQPGPDLERVRRVRPGPGRGDRGAHDTDPTPSFASPYANNATVHARPIGDAADAVVRLYVGRLRGAGGAGRGHRPGDGDPGHVPDRAGTRRSTSWPTGRASAAGASPRSSSPAAARTCGSTCPATWPRRRPAPRSPVTGSTSTRSATTPRRPTGRRSTAWRASRSPSTSPATSPQMVNTINVSAMLRPAITGDADPVPQNRFTALRSFAILACNAARRRLLDGRRLPADLPQPERRVPGAVRSGRWRRS